MNIFVGSLPFTTGEADLQEVFEAYGTVDSAKIIKDKFTGKSRGFGFVEMPNDEEGERAIEELNGFELKGRQIVVNKSEPKPEGDRRPGGGDRGGFNRGGGGGFNRGGGGGGYNRGGY